MKLLKELFFKDWRYKLIALLISISIWSVVNFGSRTAVTVSRYVELRNTSPEFTYRLSSEKVSITVYAAERLLTSHLIEEIKAFVDVSSINEPGIYRLKVGVENKLDILIHPASVDPPEIKVYVKRINRN